MLIKLCMSVGKTIFGSNQAGVALTSLLALIISSFILIMVLKYFYHDAPIVIWRCAAILYVMDPIHWMYSITIWKDILFAYTLIVFCLLLIIMDRLGTKIKLHIWILYVMASFFLCFSRTNGLYVWIFTLPFILWHFRKNIRPWLISTMVCFLLIISYKSLLLPYFQVTPPDTVEALSIPLQQVAYTVRSNGVFSEYDESIIMNIVDMESLGNAYSFSKSDPVKDLIRINGNQEYITQNKMDVIKMYLSVGVKNPVDFSVAFLNQSKGYWYQKISYWMFSFSMVDDLEAFGICRDSFFSPSFSQQIDRLLVIYESGWHYLWSLALDTYAVVIIFVYCLSRKKVCFYFVPTIGILLTLAIATPVYAEFRYAYGIYLILPAMLLQVSSRRA